MPVGRFNPPLGDREIRRKIGSVKMPKSKSKSAKSTEKENLGRHRLTGTSKPKRAPVDVMFEKFIKDPNNNPEVYNSAEYKAMKAVDPIIANAKSNIKGLEEEVDQAKEDFLQDIDDIFDPVKRKALAEKLDMTEDAIFEQLKNISARKEVLMLLQKKGIDTSSAKIEFINEPDLGEIEQFYDESVGGYIQVMNEVEEKASPPSEAEELASTLALTTDIYTDAKDGVLDVAKLTDLLANQPQTIPVSRGGYIGRTPADVEQERHNKIMEEGLKQLIEIAKTQQTASMDLGSISSSVDSVPEPHISDGLKSDLIGFPFNSGRGEANNKEVDEAKAIYKKVGQMLANHSPDTQIEDPFKGDDATRICRKLLATDVFRKFAKKKYKKVPELINTSLAWRDFKKSKDYENLHTTIEQGKADYKEMPLEEREPAWNKWIKTLAGKQPYKLNMPSKGTWINIMDGVWEDMKIKKRGKGRP